MAARFAGRVSVDVGTGDGRLSYALAREAPERLFVGIDANAANLRRRSSRAGANVLYLRAAVEDLPPELAGIADRVTVILPWGSLLSAVARPCVATLAGIRALCQPGASLTVVLGIDPARDGAELRRLELPPLDTHHCHGPLADGYAAAGFDVRGVRSLSPEQLAVWPSTWARRLAHGAGRSAIEIEARALGARRSPPPCPGG